VPSGLDARHNQVILVSSRSSKFAARRDTHGVHPTDHTVSSHRAFWNLFHILRASPTLRHFGSESHPCTICKTFLFLADKKNAITSSKWSEVYGLVTKATATATTRSGPYAGLFIDNNRRYTNRPAGLKTELRDAYLYHRLLHHTHITASTSREDNQPFPHTAHPFAVQRPLQPS
jgi:hypothetical protein